MVSRSFKISVFIIDWKNHPELLEGEMKKKKKKQKT